MHQSFVTTAPLPPPPKSHVLQGPAESHSPALYNSKFHRCVISQAPHLPGTAGGLKKSVPRTLAPLSPAHLHRWGGGAVVTNDWCIIEHDLHYGINLIFRSLQLSIL